VNPLNLTPWVTIITTGDEVLSYNGHLEEFNTRKETISIYLEQIELYFLANKIAEKETSCCVSKHDWRTNVQLAKEPTGTG